MQALVGLLWIVIVVALLFWLLGLLFHIGGALIHLALVIAIILLIVNLAQRGRLR